MAKSRKRTPKVGETYKDHEGRKLTITEVVLDCPLGRHVRGKIRFPKRLADRMGFSYKRDYDYQEKADIMEHVTFSHRKQYDYSTDLTIWSRVWRDKEPSRNPSELKAW